MTKNTKTFEKITGINIESLFSHDLVRIISECENERKRRQCVYYNSQVKEILFLLENLSDDFGKRPAFRIGEYLFNWKELTEVLKKAHEEQMSKEWE